MNRTLRSRLYKLAIGLKWCSVVVLARGLGALRRRRQIVSVWPDEPPAFGPRLALFMHYDRRGALRPQVLDYMRELASNGLTVVLVSNAGQLQPASLAAAQNICAAIIIRRNIGYDFGAWADALEHYGLPHAGTQEIIIANDSVFGPLLPLGDTLRRLDYAKADVFGLTESWQRRYHLQSFFLAFGPHALASPAFKKFWRGVRPVPLKSYVVHAYEVGISQAMLRGGLRCAALWGYEDLIGQVNREALEALILAEETATGKADPVQITRKLQALRIRDNAARRMAMNPTSDLWRQLLLSGFPFIKRELLRENPAKVEDVGDWAEVVRESLATDPEPIRLDLRTMLKGGAP